MTPEQKAAYIVAQSVLAYAEIEAMKAANLERQLAGQSLAFSESDFNSIQHKYPIGHNAVVSFFRD